MAAIEKICEYSGDYPEEAYKMYQYKRNHIQVLPKYRKLFRGAKARLVVTKVEQVITGKSGGYTEIGSLWYFQEREIPYRIVNEYYYTLIVSDSHLQGEVKGQYKNWSTNISTVRRKMRRLTRDYKLKVEGL
jgi:hypothetical protein